MVNGTLRFLLAAICCLDASARAATTVVVDFDVTSAAAAEVKNVPPPSHQALTVVLDARSFLVKSADAIELYDFAARKHVRFDMATKTRVEYSLFDNVGFRVLELRNRNGIAKAMTAAHLDKFASASDNEDDLGIAERGSQPRAADNDEGDAVFSSTDARIAGRISGDGTPVDARDAHMFAQWLRYFVPSPPQMYATVESASRIPARFMSVTSPHPVATTKTVVVKSVVAGDEVSIDPVSYPLRTSSMDADAVDAVLDRGAALTASGVADARRRSEEDIAAGFRDGRVLDAPLAWNECYSMTAESPPPLTDDQKALIRNDQAARNFLEVIGAKDKPALANAITVLTMIRPQARTRGYMIDLALANDHAMLGERDVARRMFVEVLTADPYLGGAYKDLGDALLVAWDVRRAWRSWDVGRRITPRFPSYVAVDQFERSLVSEHPEFF